VTDFLYPPESQKMDVVAHLEEFRRRLLLSLGVFLVLSFLLGSLGRHLFAIVKAPLFGLRTRLIFIGPAEAFSAYVKVVLLFSFVLCFPYFLYQIWMFCRPAVPQRIQSRILWWAFFALMLFSTGIFFAYYVAVPFALRFLVGFGQAFAEATLTVDRYVTFFVATVLAAGLVFEIPIAMAFLSSIGWLKTEPLKTKRPQALIAILVIAAVITPTPDVFNLALFSAPMYALYEAGIFIASLIENSKKRRIPNP